MSLVLNYAVRWIASGGTLLRSVVRTKDAIPKDIIVNTTRWAHMIVCRIYEVCERLEKRRLSWTSTNKDSSICPVGNGDAVCCPGKFSYIIDPFFGLGADASDMDFRGVPRRRVGGGVSCFRQLMSDNLPGLPLRPGTQTRVVELCLLSTRWWIDWTSCTPVWLYPAESQEDWWWCTTNLE